MPAADFLDTNVLVYAYDLTDPRKRSIAQDVVRRALAGESVTSTQVLSELAVTLLHKISPPISPSDLIAVLDALSPIKVICPDADMIRRALEARVAYGLHFYDCMIIAAAERARCERIWSEDLNAGQKYFDMVVENPFR